MTTIPQTDKDTQPTEIEGWRRVANEPAQWFLNDDVIRETEDASFPGTVEVELSTQNGDFTYAWLPLDLLAHILRANGYRVEAPGGEPNP